MTIASAAPIALENSYARLPEAFFARVEPTPVRDAGLIRINRALAEHLGLDPDHLASAEGLAILSGNRVPAEAEPLAMAYAGHQFGQWVPRLGDGRAVLLGEVVDRDGVRRDIQLKGAGPTPFSRSGDGRAALGPILREYIVSEAMAGLGIPTTRALAMMTTGEAVLRERAQPGAILTRVAAAHVRVGTFEYFHHRGDVEAVRALADYMIERQYPAVADAANPYRAFLEGVIERQADLIAQWMLVGFIHGVMNTDNTSIAGETIDYGPCAFMDRYGPETVYSSIDRGGRYAYNQQPGIGHWNLARFAESLLPLLDSNEEGAIASAHEALALYPKRFEASYHAGLCRKLGFLETREGDLEIAGALLELMAAQKADFTLTFRRLADLVGTESADAPALHELFDDGPALEAWVRTWRDRLRSEGDDAGRRRQAMRAANPAFIPRNHRVQQVIDAAAERGDFGPLEALLAVTTTPYDDHPERAEYARPPEPHEVVQETFCGT